MNFRTLMHTFVGAFVASVASGLASHAIEKMLERQEPEETEDE